MSMSGTSPVNYGSLFKSLKPGVSKATSPEVSALSDKISKGLADTQQQFADMEAKELKKRVEFYSRFEGRIGDSAMKDIAYQTGRMIARLSASGVVV